MLTTRKIAVLCAALAIAPFGAMADDEITALGKAKLSISGAVTATEKSTGGKVMEIKLDEEKGAPIFEAAVLSGGKVKHYKIDAATSTGMPVESKSLMDKIDMEGKAEQDAIMQAKTSLNDAIAAVEKDTGGKAVQASVEVEDKKSEYHIEVVANGKEVKKKVDTASGKIITKS